MAIPIFDTNNDRLAINYNSAITLNDPAEDVKDTYLIESSAVNPVWDAVVAPNADRDGSQSYAPRRVQSVNRMTGWVKAPNGAKLQDKIRAMNAAFDPVLAYINDVSTFDKGFLPLNFSVPTLDLTNYPDGLIPCRIYASAVRLPVGIQTKFDSYNAFFDLTLMSVDPVIYLQTTSSANRTGNGTITANNALATYLSWPIFQIVFATAPSGEMTLQRTTPAGVEIVYLDNAQLAGSQTLIVDSQARTAYYSPAGTDKLAAIKPATRFYQLRPGSNVITVAGFPSDASITVTWRRAFV